MMPTALLYHGVLSEGRIIVGRVSAGMMLDDVLSGSIVIKAMTLGAVAGFNALDEIVEEVTDLDRSLVGERRQADFYRAGFGAHGHPRDAIRRGAAISGWAKTSR